MTVILLFVLLGHSTHTGPIFCQFSVILDGVSWLWFYSIFVLFYFIAFKSFAAFTFLCMYMYALPLDVIKNDLTFWPQNRIIRKISQDYSLYQVWTVWSHSFLTCVSHTAHVTDIGCPSVRLSVTRWYCVETAQPIVKLSSILGSPMILVCWGPNFFSEFQWKHPQQGR